MQPPFFDTFSIKAIRKSAPARLGRALEQAGLATLPKDALDDFMGRYFSTRDFELVGSILTPPVQDQYRVIRRMGEYANRFDRTGNDAILVRTSPDGTQEVIGQVDIAVSEPAALSALLQGMEIARIFPDTVDQLPDGTFSFSRAGEPVATIGPVAFEEVDPVGVSRVKKLLLGVQEVGDDALLIRRLASLPGLAGIEARRLSLHSTKPAGAAVLASLESLATMLRTGVSEGFGLSLKRHQAQDIAAATFFGLPWQVVRAMADKAARAGIYARVSVITDDLGNCSFYRGGPEAIWAFAKRYEALARQPGEALLQPWLIEAFGLDSALTLNAQRVPFDTDTREAAEGPATAPQGLQPDPCEYNGTSPIAIQHLWGRTLCEADERSGPPCRLQHERLQRIYANGPDGLLAGLRAECLRTGSDLAHAEVLSLRTGEPSPLRVGAWLFTRPSALAKADPTGQLVFRHLLIEKIQDDGSLGGGGRVVATHKAELAVAPDGKGYVLLEDYGNRAELVFKEFTLSDAETLTEFAGLRRGSGLLI